MSYPYDPARREARQHERLQRQNQALLAQQVIPNDYNDPFKYKAPKRVVNKPALAAEPTTSSQTTAVPVRSDADSYAGSGLSSSSSSTAVTSPYYATSSRTTSETPTHSNSNEDSSRSSVSAPFTIIAQARIQLFEWLGPSKVVPIDAAITATAAVVEEKAANSYARASSKYALLIYTVHSTGTRKVLLRAPISSSFSFILVPHGIAAIPDPSMFLALIAGGVNDDSTGTSASADDAIETYGGIKSTEDTVWALGFGGEEVLAEFARFVALTRDAAATAAAANTPAPTATPSSSLRSSGKGTSSSSSSASSGARSLPVVQDLVLGGAGSKRAKTATVGDSAKVS